MSVAFIYFLSFFSCRAERTMLFEPSADCVMLLHAWVVETLSDAKDK